MLVLLMTGLAEPGVLKWFLETFISVQNVKKWEKRILDGYDSLRTFLHEHVIPASERIVIVLSRLRGLSIWSSPHLKNVCLILRSNKSGELALHEEAIEQALMIHDTFFLRVHEMLRDILIERSSFEYFSSWLLVIAEDIFSSEDSTFDPPLHTIDTPKVGEYITNRLQNPILADFAPDLTGDKGFLSAVGQLMEIMKGYFENAAGELREGVEWMLPGWIDLGVHEEIAASDVHITSKVPHCQNAN